MTRSQRLWREIDDGMLGRVAVVATVGAFREVVWSVMGMEACSLV